MRRPTSSLRPPFVHLVVTRFSRTAPGQGLDNAPPWWATTPPPQRPSLGSGLFCPGPSSLNWPHPPHSRAHPDFTAWRLIRDAFAVRERLGDPRVVPSFRCSFLPDMPPSPTTESPTSILLKGRADHPDVQAAMRTLEEAIRPSPVALDGVATTPEQIAAMTAKGYQALAVGFDWSLLQRGIQSSIAKPS